MRKLSSTVRLIAVFALVLIMLAGCVMQATTYTVNFNTDGGTYIPSAQVQQNQTVAEPTPPTKDGYTFAGWYKQGSNTPFSFATKITSNITLVARWTANSSQGGGDNTGTQTENVKTTAHVRFEATTDGFKLTLNNDVREGGVHVHENGNELPFYIDVNVDETRVYYYRLTEQGKSYNVQFWGKDYNNNEIDESVTLRALGGYKTSDVVDLSKFNSSSVSGSYTNFAYHHVSLPGTAIQKESDIVKRPDLIRHFHIDFFLLLGDYETDGKDRWHSGASIYTKGYNDTSFGTELRAGVDIRNDGWGNPLTDSLKQEYNNKYRFGAEVYFNVGDDRTLYHTYLKTSPVYQYPSTVEPVAAETTHMKVKATADGFKITVKDRNNLNYACISVENSPVDVRVRPWDRNDYYLYPFVQAGNQYTIHLDADLPNGQHYHDSVTCSATGGHNVSNWFDLDKFYASRAEGSYIDDEHFKAKMTSTSISNPSDLIKTNFIKDFSIDFCLVLGDGLTVGGNENWCLGTPVRVNDLDSKTNGEFGNKLKTFQTIIEDRDDFCIDENLKKEYSYTYKIAVEPNFRLIGTNQECRIHEFFTPLYQFTSSNANEKWIARPNLTPFAETGAESIDDDIKNVIRIEEGSDWDGGYLTFSSFGNDWQNYDVINIKMEGEIDHDVCIMIIDKGKDANENYYAYGGGNGQKRRTLEVEHLDEYEPLTVSYHISDIKDYFTEKSISAENQAICFMYGGESLFRISSVTLQKYPHKNDLVIFDPAAYNEGVFMADGGDTIGEIVNLSGTKYLKVTTKDYDDDDAGPCAVIDLNPKSIPAGYMRIKAECFVLDENKTDEYICENAYGFCFLLIGQDSDSNGFTSFLQHPVFNTKDNYKSHGASYNTIRCRDILPSKTVTINQIKAWTNNNKYAYFENDAMKWEGTATDDFEDLSGKTFYIGKIIAYGGTGN